MKIIISFFSILCLLLLFSVNVISQKIQSKSTYKCGTDLVHQQRLLNEPGYQQAYEELNTYVKKFMDQHPNGLDTKSTIYIPLVFHEVLSASEQASFPDSRIDEMITMLNRDFAGLNPHSMGAFSANLKANVGIQFYKAAIDPLGNPTNGIEKVVYSGPQWTSGDPNLKLTNLGGLDAWDPTRYFNIWICNFTGGLCGYGIFPSSLSIMYGLAIDYEHVGQTGATPPYNNGGCAAHEIAHCFNLPHIWSQQGCLTDDGFADTPMQDDATYGNPSGILTDACSLVSPGIMYMNFMDYSDDAVLANFTPDQKTAMLALFAPGGVLNPIADVQPITNVFAGNDKRVCGQNTILFGTPLFISSSLQWTCLSGPVSFLNDTLNYTSVEIPAYSQDSVIYTFVLSETNNNLSYYSSDTINVTFLLNCNLIKGQVFHDLNQNGINDSSDFGAIHWVVKIEDFYASTDSLGNYSCIVPNGTYNITLPSTYNGFVSNPASHFASFSNNSETDSLNNFSVINNNNENLKIFLYVSAIRPGFTSTHCISINNLGTAAVYADVKFYLDPNLIYSSSSLSPDSISGNMFEWRNVFLDPMGWSNILVYAYVPDTLTLGINSIDSAFVYPIINDIEPQNNSITTIRIVTNSYDPNEKTVEPAVGLFPDQITNGDWLNYTIHFQNTGNDTAFTVVIKDTLSTLLDISSLQITGFSHPVTMQLNGHGIITFTFNNILLPDSNVNLLGSNGFVSYQVKPLSTLAIGNNISNTAFIYFDYNLPIVTNTTQTPVLNPLIVESHNLNNQALQVMPNPFTEICKLTYSLSTPSEVVLEVYDIRGNKIETLCNSFQPTGTFIRFLSSDKLNDNQIYIIRLVINNQQSFSKILKL